MFFATAAILETGASVITGVDWSNNTEPNPLSDKRKMADCLADFESVESASLIWRFHGWRIWCNYVVGI